MSSRNNFSTGQSSTYFLRSSMKEEEYRRSLLQEQLLTKNMGGVLPEQSDATRFKDVLDIGCGTGSWLIELAQTYPTIHQLVGVDINRQMLDYAHAEAEKQQVADRIDFQAKDIMMTFDFPDKSFDLVNIRFGASFLRAWEWSRLLQEFRRTLKPEGVARIIEFGEMSHDSSSLTMLNDLLLQAIFKSGHSPDEEGAGVIDEVTSLLHQFGFQQVQTRPCDIEYRAGTPSGEMFYENIKQTFLRARPFMNKWIRLPENYEQVYQQALDDIQQPGFVVIRTVQTVWGTIVGA